MENPCSRRYVDLKERGAHSAFSLLFSYSLLSPIQNAERDLSRNNELDIFLVSICSTLALKGLITVVISYMLREFDVH
jgi:hypothetical protein